ncbi:MAG: RluA family pseudouridine synthase [Spirochaetia bacterium]|jgi:23S rRNA pseudouridine1911/1915/1917 synthase|nr:RluA family pseudouridine synthase [Spirochaetia bacterium]
MTKRLSFAVPPDVRPGTRADKYLAALDGLCSRSQLKNSLEEIRINGKPARLSKPVKPGDLLEIVLREEEAPRYEPEKMDLDILYEDEHVIVVNKPRALVVHPGSGTRSGTLVQGLLYHAREIAARFPDEKLRPGIVHRLDKDTSGLLIAAKDPQSLECLASQFRGRRVKKRYLAIVKGHPPRSEGVIEGFIKRDPRRRQLFVHSASGGKAAETRYRVLAECAGYSLVRLSPKTGRTHQLRVHMKSLGCPILGDTAYGRADPGFPEAPLMLHAGRLSLVLPGEENKRTFRAPVPPDFRELAGILFPGIKNPPYAEELKKTTGHSDKREP